MQDWNMTRKLKNMKNEIQTHFELEYGGNTQKKWKIRNSLTRNWNMEGKQKIMRKTHSRT